MFFCGSSPLWVHDTALPHRISPVVSFFPLCLSLWWTLHAFVWFSFCSDALQQSFRCVRQSINACVCWWRDRIAWIVHVWESVVTFYDLVCLVSNVRFLFCSFWHTQMPDIQEWTDICGQMHGAGAAAGRSPHGLTWRDLLFCYAPFLKGHKSALTKCDSEARCTTAACTCHARPP